MEPSKITQINGLAPIIQWSEITPSLQTSPSHTPNSFRYSRAATNSSGKLSCISSTSSIKKPLVIDNPCYEGAVKFNTDNNDSIILSTTSSSSSIDLTIREKLQKSKYPDGGWGWVVVFASLCVSMIADGISFTFGLLYIEFLNEFKESKSTTSWIGSLFMAVPLLSGPIMSTFVDKYGCKNMTMLGGFISGIGFILCTFATDIKIVFLTFGIIAGLGLGFCYVTAVVSILLWFDKKRSLATGLGACGSGLGTFLFSPVTRFLIDEYGWRGTVLLLSGAFFNVMVFGALMRDPEWVILEQNSPNDWKEKTSRKTFSSYGESISKIETRSISNNEDTNYSEIGEVRRLIQNGENPEQILTSLVNSITVQKPNNLNVNNENNFRSVINIPTYLRQKEKVPLEVIELLTANPKINQIIIENYPYLLFSRSLKDLGENAQLSSLTTQKAKTFHLSEEFNNNFENDLGNTCLKNFSTNVSTKKSDKNGKRNNIKNKKSSNENLDTEKLILPLDNSIQHNQIDREKGVKDIRNVKKHHLKHNSLDLINDDNIFSALNIINHGIINHYVYHENIWLKKQLSTRQMNCLEELKSHKSSYMHRGAMIVTTKYRLRATSCPNILRNSVIVTEEEEQEKWYKELIELLKAMFDFSLFLELHFIFFQISTTLLFIWFIVPYFYLAEHMVRNGYTEIEASNLLSYIGVVNAIGMITLGWAGDQPWLNVKKSYAICLILCGLSTMAIPIFTFNIYFLTLFALLFGYFFASTYSFTPVILMDLVPLDQFTTAYGLCLLCQGIGNLVGPPIAGLLFDLTQSWNQSFYQAGIGMILSGLAIYGTLYTKNINVWFQNKPISKLLENENVA